MSSRQIVASIAIVQSRHHFRNVENIDAHMTDGNHTICEPQVTAEFLIVETTLEM